jgi:hypothetical protein
MERYLYRMRMWVRYAALTVTRGRFEWELVCRYGYLDAHERLCWDSNIWGAAQFVT